MKLCHPLRPHRTPDAHSPPTKRWDWCLPGEQIEYILGRRELTQGLGRELDDPRVGEGAVGGRGSCLSDTSRALLPCCPIALCHGPRCGCRARLSRVCAGSSAETAWRWCRAPQAGTGVATQASRWVGEESWSVVRSAGRISASGRLGAIDRSFGRLRPRRGFLRIENRHGIVATEALAWERIRAADPPCSRSHGNRLSILTRFVHERDRF